MLLWLAPLALADRPAFIAAVANTEAPDPLSLLITYGPLGIFIVLLATGQFRTKYEVQRLENQVETLMSENREKDALIQAFQMQLTGHTLPALAQSARVFEAIPNSESDLVAQLKQAREEVAALTRHLDPERKGDSP